jgi:hypothetical protein
MIYGMKRLRSPAWANALVLAVLCLRAMVPAGYMLAPAGDHPAFVLCSAAMALSAREKESGEPHRAGAAHQGGAHSDPDCPYAHSAGPAPLPTLPGLANAALCHPEVARVHVTPSFSPCGPTRRQTPRGPPSAA